MSSWGKIFDFLAQLRSTVENPNSIHQMATTEIVKGSFSFALDAYKKLSVPEANLVVSPFSLSTALAMTLCGAKGNTASEMGQILFGKPYVDSQCTDMAEGVEELIKKSITDNGKVLRVANYI